MTWKTFGFAALALSSVVLSTRTAEADVSEPSPAFVLLPASPGIATAAGALVTTVGSAATQADGEPSTGWSIASLVTGSLSMTSGAIYTGVVADGNAEPGLFTALAASNFALGASNIVLGVVGLTTDVSPTTVGLLPRVSVDGEGRKMAVVSGAF
jgi:hypothetical protein